MTEQEQFVVVVARHGAVQCVLGPQASEMEAQAVKDTIRLSGARTATVHRVRAPDAQDMHGEVNAPTELLQVSSSNQ
jgi:hypothetical protein